MSQGDSSDSRDRPLVDVSRMGPAELARMQRLATLGTIAAVIAHEFNNILTPMITYCQMAQAEPEDRELVAKAVSRSLDGALRAAEITQSMLGFVREAEGAGVCEVAAVVEEVFACLVREPAKDGIDLRVDVPAGLGAGIGRRALQQVLLNLVLNARKAMLGRGRGGRAGGAGGGSLAITAMDGAAVVIEVADSGPGIPAGLRGREFEAFATAAVGGESGDGDAASRADSEDAASGEANSGEAHQADQAIRAGAVDAEPGTGLGLAVCKSLLLQAGGDIEIAQTGPAGTTFRITLPRAQI